MPYNKNLVDELNILIRYNLDTTLEGIKVHKTASTDNIAATKRLFQYLRQKLGRPGVNSADFCGLENSVVD